VRDAGVDKFGFFGAVGEAPIIGDWSGDGKRIGIFRAGCNLFALATNNAFAYEASTEKIGHFGRVAPGATLTEIGKDSGMQSAPRGRFCS
jgi:hypothetical protein